MKSGRQYEVECGREECGCDFCEAGDMPSSWLSISCRLGKKSGLFARWLRNSSLDS